MQTNTQILNNSKDNDINKEFQSETIIHNGLEYKTVKSPYTGKIWLDRNLGAKRVATSYDDKESFGDYFQWGRASDNHEKNDSEMILTLSSSSTPNHAKFITSNPASRNDWLYEQNDKLWDGVNAVNNPSPKGFRIPTMEELEVETANQGVKNKIDIFQNFLKFPSPGYRPYSSGLLYEQGFYGGVWSCSVDGKYAKDLYFDCDGIDLGHDYRAFGLSVRCIKD